MALKVTALTQLIAELNAMLDTGKYDNISVAEVRKHIDAGDILRYIKGVAGTDIDLSLLLGETAYGDFEGFYSSYLQNINSTHGGQTRRKWGVENRGLCLLIAWTAEIIKQGSGWQVHPNMVDVKYP